MTKQELLNDLSSKFFRVGVVKIASASETDAQIREAEGIKWYVAGVYESKDNILWRRNINFYVADEGTETEQAFYQEALPSNAIPATIDNPYRPEVEELIKAQITSGNILKGTIDQCDDAENFAIVRAFIQENGAITEKKYFVHKDEQAINHFDLMTI